MSSPSARRRRSIDRIAEVVREGWSVEEEEEVEEKEKGEGRHGERAGRVCLENVIGIVTRGRRHWVFDVANMRSVQILPSLPSKK